MNSMFLLTRNTLNESVETHNLFDAARRNDTEKVKFLVEVEHASLDVTNDMGETVAHIGAKNGNLQLVEYVLKKEPPVLKEDDWRFHNLFQLAVEKNAFAVVKYLIEEQNADISQGTNCPDYGTTALHTATKFGHLNMLKYFIEERNGNVNITDWQDTPIVFFAVKYQHTDLMKYLIEDKNASLTMVDRYKENILYITVRNDDLTAMKYLLDEVRAPLDVNWRNVGGETLVHTAVLWNHVMILKYLIGEKHADVNIPDQWHFRTPLHYAASKNRSEICKYLVEHGADPQFQDDLGRIPEQLTTNERLITYFKGIPRTRRSAVELDFVCVARPIPLPYSEQTAQKIGDTTLETSNFLSVDGTADSLNHFHSSNFTSFLMIAETVIKSAKILKHHQQSTPFTPQTMLRSKIDTNALYVATDASTFNY